MFNIVLILRDLLAVYGESNSSWKATVRKSCQLLASYHQHAQLNPLRRLAHSMMSSVMLVNPFKINKFNDHSSKNQAAKNFVTF